jgi:energy-coupling factor transporter ATP-binding protein EcfA2
MYIKSVEIKNIRSISHFKMDFDKPAGWHVLIGDNGSGKSSIVRAIALALIGPKDAQALRLPLINWIQKNKEAASIALQIQRDKDYDGYAGLKRPLLKPFEAAIKLTKEMSSGFEIARIDRNGKGGTDPFEYIWSGKRGWFSTSFGPFRRFTGGDKEWSKVYYSNPSAAAHLSVFGEDVALTESLEWLSQMKFKSFEQNSEAINTLEALKKFINEGSLLPHNTQLVDVTSAGVFFKDGNGNEIDVTQLSDGFRSLLSLIFELIRQFVKTYGEGTVFKEINENKMQIDVSGVVLIDEIDAHLHPTWQTRIGQWFTKYFPNIQFIVSSHSPLVCRASHNGSIWRLAAPGSSHPSGEVTGIEKEKLVSGNILDAYGTELFGQTPVRSEQSDIKLERLGKLNMMSVLGKISVEEENERLHLQKILSTDAPTGI